MFQGNSNFQHVATTRSLGRHSPGSDSIQIDAIPIDPMKWSSANLADDHLTRRRNIDDGAHSQTRHALEESAESQASAAESVDISMGTVDDAFELLSAYLDNEVTVAERCLVEHWLACDPVIRSDYQKQLRLRQAFKSFMGGA